MLEVDTPIRSRSFGYVSLGSKDGVSYLYSGL